MEDYNDIQEMLRPRRDFKASDALHERIKSTLDERTGGTRRFRWVWLAAASCAAAAVLCLILVPGRLSASDILTEAMESFRKTERVEMALEIRTTPLENFRYISLDADFVPHKVQLMRSDSSMAWRVEKGGRVAAGQGGDTYIWLKNFNIGWHLSDTRPAEVLGYVATLLSPERILEEELDNCIHSQGADYTVARNRSEIILTVKAGAKGDFTNPYMLNSSIEESEHLRRYVIDADTRRLKGASVRALCSGREVEILRITSIEYDAPLDGILARPSSVRFVGTGPQGIMGLNATEAAMAFLSALESWNDEILGQAVELHSFSTLYREYLQGAVVDSVGYAFTSGDNENSYVPYRLLMSDGSVKRHNLAMRKVPGGGWLVVGGL